MNISFYIHTKKLSMVGSMTKLLKLMRPYNKLNQTNGKIVQYKSIIFTFLMFVTYVQFIEAQTYVPSNCSFLF